MTKYRRVQSIVNIVYIEDERQAKTDSKNLKLIYNHWSYDTVSDDEIERVLKPVRAMINAGAFNRSKNMALAKIAESICS